MMVGPPLRLIQPRYADFTFYNELSGHKRGAALSSTETLQASSRYQLEVAVRAKRRGIQPVDTAEPIREPEAKQPVSILVVADSPDNDFEIPEPVQRLILPPEGDSSENAWFRGVLATRRTNTTSELLHLRVRLYYNLNLIEVVIIEAEAVSPLEDSRHSRLGLDEPVRFQQFLHLREYRNLDLLLPRSMHIQVTPVVGGFHLAFLLGREDRPDVLLPGTVRISEGDLESSLCEIRKGLFGITVWDGFGKTTACADECQFNRGIGNLARLGRDLWTKIFEVERESALFQIGEWLRSHPLPRGSLIQVSNDPGAYAFVLPWNLLYDRDLPDDPDTAPDVHGFWGIRYQVEQRAAIPDTANDRPCSVASVDIGFLTWPFEEVSLQRTFLDELVSLSRGRIGELHAIDSAEAALTYLSAGGDDIICFFAHGHTQFREASEVGFSEADFVRLYETLPESSDLRSAWKYSYEQIKQRQYESDRSWIQLRSGRVYLPQLYQKRDLKLGKRPIVLLSMCESAQLTPSLRESFIHFFLDRGAIAVIGTECSMRPLFAHHFAKELLERLLTGSTLGEAMLDVRLYFLRQRNPLGFAYTLFGSPLARFDPALLERRSTDLPVSESFAVDAGQNPEGTAGV
ncbi:MAG TPA: hypothetical protein VGS10_04045 [Terracidiphilus sp.]|nr:hypothetical protein [Terracidiphilus sp.]